MINGSGVGVRPYTMLILRGPQRATGFSLVPMYEFKGQLAFDFEASWQATFSRRT
jgi:hypothetical protein